ncbi:MAG: hypothetical protein Q9M33_07235 [Robiginitomaculum sp.]|nr:hypothetical protein [Robiginitomaculum sp.]MDQ7077569.1 hypothetical protein [Robiginitomaculum sp.]
MSFSADKAAFFVFDKREGKGTLRTLGIVYVVVRMILLAGVFAIMAPFLIKALPILLETTPETTEFNLQIQSLGNTFQAIGLLSSLFFLPVFISIYTALLRWMIKGEYGGKWFGLRFGEPELQVLVSMIAVGVVLFFGILFSLLPLGILIGLAAVMKQSGNAGLFVIMSIAYGVIWLGGIVWASVRLAPAPALTFQRGKIQVFETFAVSKGHFWGLFFAYVLQFFVLLAMSIGLLFVSLLVSLPFLGIGVAMFGWQEPDMANVGAYVALAAVPLLIITITGLVVEYIRYAMGAGVGACLVVSQEEAAKPSVSEAPITEPDPDEAAAPEDKKET